MAFRTETQADIRCRISNDSTNNWNRLFTHIQHCAARQLSGWTRGFSALISSPHFWIFTSVLVGSSNRPYLFTSAMVQILHTESKRGYNPISTWHSTFEIHFALTEVVPKSPFLFEQKLFPVRFSCQQNLSGKVWTLFKWAVEHKWEL